MAVQVGDKSFVPTSTGEVDGPPDSVESTQLADNASTGAVRYGGDIGETVVEHKGSADPVVVVQPPASVEMTLSWAGSDRAAAADEQDKPQPETKVIGAPAKRAPKKAAAKPETK